MAQTTQRISHFWGGLGVSLERLTLLESRRGRHRTIRVFDHPELGHVFMLGQEIQHVEAWASLYHEPLVHLAASFVREVRQVLIFGGGTLFAAAEVLKYRSVERVLLIDHDPVVTAVAVRHYAHAKRCLADGRLQLVTQDAYSVGESDRHRFDLAINDGLDLLEVPPAASGKHAFARLGDLVAPHGVCSDLIQRHVFERSRIRTTVHHLRRHSRVALSLVAVPEYHGVLHVLALWGPRKSNIAQTAKQPENLEQRRWAKRPSTCPCVYYDPRFLPYYLYLPPYLRATFKRNSA